MVSGNPWFEIYPYSRPETFQGNITQANTETQLMNIPYTPPDNVRTHLLAFHFSNPTTNPAIVILYDKAVADATVSAGYRGVPTAAPMLRVTVPASGDNYGEAVTRPWFQTGVAGQSTAANLYYSLYVVHVGMG